MNKERILSYCKSQELTADDLTAVTGGKGTNGTIISTAICTYSKEGCTDIQYDATPDF